MSLFQNLLDSINGKGGQMLNHLGDRAFYLNHAVEGPFDGLSRPGDDVCALAQSLVTDCQQLISLLVPRRMQLLQLAFAGALPAAVAVVSHFKVADTIEELGGEATAVEIAAKVDTDATKLANVLRTLTAHYVFEEHEGAYFTNNRQSRELVTKGGGAAMMESYAQTSGKALPGLLPLMTDKELMHSSDPRQSAFSKAHGAPIGIFDYVFDPRNHDELMTLMAGLPWLSETSARESVQHFDWSRWGKEAQVCDMGCADGGIMAHLKIKEPSLHIICQDLAPILPRTRATMEQMVPGALENGGIEIMEHDYFIEQTRLADVYWMRAVLHDYSDDDCVTILQRLKPRMLENPQARLLINEVIVPSLPTLKGSENRPISETKPQRQSSFVEITSVMQLHSVAMQGGFERTYQDFEAIFKRAGFRVHHFYPLQFFTAIVEVAPENPPFKL
ncbi:uncharacterized protein A1O5_10846 [Cladophialophora psammophila CBS 110553]|uniref:Uncharacterized protein n=1 Tax=Cladophialophora psammophila CBS 110553 TaxID=1182543 RepID=W9WMI6_9EURO|nr:uncharacterized protein A1O5_10846 [Cladophialophora psammophila CBS 110553]EXJ66230.1 hypothetical protein A1O5_10846 [Cladophialophora psammophila CBS 110553]